MASLRATSAIRRDPSELELMRADFHRRDRLEKALSDLMLVLLRRPACRTLPQARRAVTAMRGGQATCTGHRCARCA